MSPRIPCDGCADNGIASEAQYRYRTHDLCGKCLTEYQRQDLEDPDEKVAPHYPLVVLRDGSWVAIDERPPTLSPEEVSRNIRKALGKMAEAKPGTMKVELSTEARKELGLPYREELAIIEEMHSLLDKILTTGKAEEAIAANDRMASRVWKLGRFLSVPDGRLPSDPD